MYLDTDIILALVKQDDWLKKHVDISKLKRASTSVLTIIEARIVLERELSREKVMEVSSKIKSLKIKILAIDEKIMNKSQELLRSYPELNIFDSVHASCAIIYDKILISSDTIFPLIKELKSRDPRTL